MADPKQSDNRTPTNKNNVIVVGGGITGISTAIFLLDDGHNVTLFETGQPDKGTSSGNAGVISVASCVPTATLAPSRVSHQCFSTLMVHSLSAGNIFLS